MLASETASKMTSIGFPPVSAGRSARIASADRVRSTTCVAPREVSRAALRGDAVVMIGLKPDSFASWMAA